MAVMLRAELFTAIRRDARGSGADRIARLEGEPVVGVCGDPVELIVERHENLPRLLTVNGSKALHHQLLELGSSYPACSWAEPGPDSSSRWTILPMSCVAAPNSMASRSSHTAR